MMRFLLFCVVLLSIFACSNNKGTAVPMYQAVDNSGIVFSNNILNTKDFNILTYRNFYNGAGVASGDLNNDGMPEVLLIANMGENKIFLNQGDFKFKDITKSSQLLQKGKWATGITLVDINADGWLDIYICYAGYQKGIDSKNELYINNHDLTFTENAHAYNLDEDGLTTHAAFFDYDMDGDLDVYILNNSFIPVNTLNYSNKRNLRANDWPVKDFLKGGGDKLLRNDKGVFVDVSKTTGIYGSLIGFGLGVTVGDINGDAYPDIYISNDFFEKDYLYINQKNGTFKEDLESWMQHVSHSSMGADMADINNDGYPDIFVTDMLPQNDFKLKTTSLFNNYDVHHYMQQQGFYNQYMQNTLQLNNQNGKFSEIAHYSGVAASDWSWGGLIFDANNDGLSDIFVCNGINHDVTNQDFMDFFANEIIQNMVMKGNKAEVSEVISKMPSTPVANTLFINQGNLKFIDNAKNEGLGQPSFSNGAVYTDLDNDGDLDIIINNINQPASVYKNNASENKVNYNIRFQLKDTTPNTLNPFCIGATIKVFCDKEIISRELIPSRGFQSSVDYVLHIGLGSRKIDSVYIRWQDGNENKLNTYELNKKNNVFKPQHFIAKTSSKNNNNDKILSLIPSNFIAHNENAFVDFYQERAIPMMLSQEGPKAAIADINGDGNDDVYICGASGQTGNLYIQSHQKFINKPIANTKQFANAEETAAAFIDINGDGFLDLWIASGGNQFFAPALELLHRLYINDGKGNFTLTNKIIPQNDVNVSFLLPLDFDNDNDMDIFVGGRNLTQQYGLDANSYLLENDGSGNFKIFLTDNKNPFEKLGMLTAGAFKPILDKTNPSLILTGEWMGPIIFNYKNNTWKKQNSNLETFKGWWQSMHLADFNNDGLTDIILGNIGENFYLQPSVEKPIKLWLNDFDKNGYMEKIITRVVDGKDVSVFLKKELTDQVPQLRKQNLKYAEFASKSIQDIFGNSILETSIVKDVNTSSSLIAINLGNGKFEIKPLLQAIQFSSLQAIQSIDINKDGNLDLILGGNNFDILPQFSRLDASFGNIAINKGNGVFECVSAIQRNWTETKEVKDLQIITLNNIKALLVLRNNETPLLYNINGVKK